MTETETMQAALDDILRLKGCKSGNGPSMGYFEEAPDGAGRSKRHVYLSFGMNGPKDQGASTPAAHSFDELLKATRASFTAWLQPERTLVWRIRPEVEAVEGLWRVYFRCIQIDDDADGIAIIWPLA